MKKTLLLGLALLLTSMAFSARQDLPLSGLGTSGWGGFTTDGKGSVTYVGEWTGCGWWLKNANVPSDFSAYNKLVINFEPLPFMVRIVIEYDNDTPNSELDIAKGMTTGEVELNPAGASKVMQIYLQSGGGGVGTIVVKEAYFTDGKGEAGTTSTAVYNFNSETIGKVYPTMHAWGWPEGGTSAAVVKDPLREGNCVKMIAGNYDGVFYFTVTLPEGSTVADIKEIKFESYFGDKKENAAVELIMAAKNASIGNGVGFGTYPVYLKTSDSDSKPTPVIQVSEPGKWFPISFTKEQISNPNFNFGVKYDFAAINSLSEFLFGIGVSGPAGTEYFVDNIEFVLKGSSRIHTVNTAVSKAYGIDGVIVVSGANENVSIYGIDGRLVKQTVVSSTTTIPVNQGIYIVRVGTVSPVKVMVK